MNHATDLDRLTEAVLSSAKYRAIAPDLVAAIGGRELAHRASLKAAIKATKNKLHQIAAAYQQGQPDYPQWLAALHLARREDALRPVCAELMQRHRSTAERLPILEQFYDELFADIAPVDSILDLGCGLNPLAIPWMGLGPSCAYHACDIYRDQVDFLNGFFELAGVGGEAEVWDLLQGAPDRTADVAFLFKVIPCLEQADKQIGARLLETVQAETLFVSFPSQSLGGRAKGMARHYAAHFDTLIAGRSWAVKAYEFDTELVFRLKRG